LLRHITSILWSWTRYGEVALTAWASREIRLLDMFIAEGLQEPFKGVPREEGEALCLGSEVAEDRLNLLWGGGYAATVREVGDHYISLKLNLAGVAHAGEPLLPWRGLKAKVSEVLTAGRGPAPMQIIALHLEPLHQALIEERA